MGSFERLGGVRTVGDRVRHGEAVRVGCSAWEPSPFKVWMKC